MTKLMQQMTLPGLDEAVQGRAGRGKWPMVKLGEIAPSRSSKREFLNEEIVWDITLDQIESNTGKIFNKKFSKVSDAPQSSNFVDEDNVLYSKLRPYLNKVIIPEEKGFATTELVPLYPDKKRLNKRFLLHFLMSPGFVSWATNTVAGAKMPRLTMSEFWKHKIPLPPLPEQQRIVARLDKAQQLIDQRKEQLALMDALVQSLFYEMFGDPVKNEKGWEEVYLQEVADIASGVTKGRNLAGKETHEIPYMRVANVQDGHLNLSSIATIPVTSDEMNRYKLLKGDLLLTEGGDPDKLGRGAIWQAEIEPCIHQNHIFRVRLNAQKLLPGFASALIASPRCKRYFLSAAKQTTGIASINMTQLKKSPMLLPPLPLQQAFADRVEQIEALKQGMTASLRELEQNFNALMQEAFGG
jgi:type I restriction enzyme, S subunit